MHISDFLKKIGVAERTELPNAAEKPESGRLKLKDILRKLKHRDITPEQAKREIRDGIAKK